MRKLKMRKAVAVIISVFLLILAMPLSGEWDKAFAAASDYEINETYRDCNITFNNIVLEENTEEVSDFYLSNKYGSFQCTVRRYLSDRAYQILMYECEDLTEFDSSKDKILAFVVRWETEAETMPTISILLDSFDVKSNEVLTEFFTGVTFRAYSSHVLEVFSIEQAEYEKYEVTVRYLEALEDKPFAIQKTKTVMIPQGDITVDILTEAVGVESFDCLRSQVKKVWEAPEGNGKYVVDLEYSTVDFTTITADGTATLVQVGLTPFSLVKKPDGKNFALTDLNQGGKVYFSEGDYRSSDLYGYFYQAILKTNVSDLNFFFRETTYDGCQVYFGWSRWEFNPKNLVENPEKLLLTTGLTLVCPIVGFVYGTASSIDVYDIYCMYLDLTTPDGEAFIGANGAENVNDYTSAFDRWWEEVSESIGNPMKILIAVLGAVLIVIVIVKIIDLVKERERNKPRK